MRLLRRSQAAGRIPAPHRQALRQRLTPGRLPQLPRAAQAAAGCPGSGRVATGCGR
ncbi:hypothetical protein [Paenibacillus barengoltzii]|uniref:hypothetical protein n=1 Tax=Paenibacillus barengoltzii TaxID=343517 RepID=UPI00387A2876